jgi:pyruvate-ferredoxin/flavodoxin oxidoreductase
MAQPDSIGSVQGEGSAAAAIARAEAAAGAAIISASAGAALGAPVERAPGAAEAIRAASARARAGERAAALLAADELLGALDALREAAAARAPITVHVAGRRGGLAVGRDELAPALDVGAGVIVTWSAQDAADVALIARRASEDSETPFLHVHDGPRPDAPVVLPGPELVERFLGARRAAPSFADAPLGPAEDAGGAPTLRRDIHRKRAERGFAARVPFALASAMRQLSELTGRPTAPVERVETADADEIVVAIGCAYPAARDVVRALRAEGRRVGLVGVRSIRPFFSAEVVKALGRASAIVVIEPFDVALAPSGPVAAGVKAAFADALTWAPGFPGIGRIPPIISAAFATIDGVITERDVRLSLAEIASGERARRVVVFGSDG